MGKIGGIQKEKPSYEGHRERLRKRFLEGGLEGFLDYKNNQKFKIKIRFYYNFV